MDNRTLRPKYTESLNKRKTLRKVQSPSCNNQINNKKQIHKINELIILSILFLYYPVHHTGQKLVLGESSRSILFISYRTIFRLINIEMPKKKYQYYIVQPRERRNHLIYTRISNTDLKCNNKERLETSILSQIKILLTFENYKQELL